MIVLFRNINYKYIEKRLSVKMTSICAIYSNLVQSRQPILSFTKTTIRVNTQTHVRHHSILIRTHPKPSIVTPVSKLNRTVPALRDFFKINQFGGFLLTVSIFFLKRIEAFLFQPEII